VRATVPVLHNDHANRGIGQEFQELWALVIQPRANFGDRVGHLIAVRSSVSLQPLQIIFPINRGDTRIQRHIGGTHLERIANNRRSRIQLIGIQFACFSPSIGRFVCHANLPGVGAQFHGDRLPQKRLNVFIL
jgi:hypothetical protein